MQLYYDFGCAMNHIQSSNQTTGEKWELFPELVLKYKHIFQNKNENPYN